MTRYTKGIDIAVADCLSRNITGNALETDFRDVETEPGFVWELGESEENGPGSNPLEHPGLNPRTQTPQGTTPVRMVEGQTI